MNVDAAWLDHQIAVTPIPDSDTPAVRRLRVLLQDWAVTFAQDRADVESALVTWPRRGLYDDEASSFLRALDTGLVTVDASGFCTLPTVRAKTPAGRYALLSKSGSGVSVNLEYLVQIGATAELVLDHGWSPADLAFERGEFDALGVGTDGRILLAVEAKARVSGPDSLQKMLETWLLIAEDASIDLNTNAGRKYRELHRLCQLGRTGVWLVAEGARWTLVAELVDGSVSLTPASTPTMRLCQQMERDLMNESFAYDARYHRPKSVAAAGRCSQHGADCCDETPIISFQDRHNRWQSGCQRALEQLVARVEISAPIRRG